MPYGKYGVYVPESGDESSTTWQPGITDNWNKFVDHNHDGVNSSPINFGNIQKKFSTVRPSDFSALVAGKGLYEATVSMPAGLTFDNTFMRFKIADTGVLPYAGGEFYPTIVRTANAKFKLFVNRNDLTIKVLYL